MIISNTVWEHIDAGHIVEFNRDHRITDKRKTLGDVPLECGSFSQEAGADRRFAGTTPASVWGQGLDRNVSACGRCGRARSGYGINHSFCDAREKRSLLVEPRSSGLKIARGLRGRATRFRSPKWL
jgi:hypothetical protein